LRSIFFCIERWGGGDNDVHAVVVLLPLLPCPSLSTEMGFLSREDGAP